MTDIIDRLVALVPTYDTVAALAVILGVGIAVLIVFILTVVPVLDKILSVPVNWCTRGVPVLPTAYDGPDVEFVTSYTAD